MEINACRRMFLLKPEATPIINIYVYYARICMYVCEY